MRISEKTLELSFCSQLVQYLGLVDSIWFGLTQRQERELGFDACSRINGRLVIFQFKASNKIIYQHTRHRQRRFTIPHRQLESLQKLANNFRRCVYYVFPDIGNTLELSRDRNLVSQTWLMDVSRIPYPFPAPINRVANHYAYIDPPHCELRSKPSEIELINVKEFGEELLEIGENAEEIVSWLKKEKFIFQGMRAYGLLLPQR